MPHPLSFPSPMLVGPFQFHQLRVKITWKDSGETLPVIKIKKWLVNNKDISEEHGETRGDNRMRRCGDTDDDYI